MRTIGDGLRFTALFTWRFWLGAFRGRAERLARHLFSVSLALLEFPPTGRKQKWRDCWQTVVAHRKRTRVYSRQDQRSLMTGLRAALRPRSHVNVPRRLDRTSSLRVIFNDLTSSGFTVVHVNRLRYAISRKLSCPKLSEKRLWGTASSRTRRVGSDTRPRRLSISEGLGDGGR